MVELTTEANVANAYFSVLALRERVDIAQKNIDAAKRILAITQAKVTNGVLSNLELAQQTAQVLGEEAQIPAMEEQEREARNALAILLGRMPEGFEVKGNTLEGIVAPPVQPGMPASLLFGAAPTSPRRKPACSPRTPISTRRGRRSCLRSGFPPTAAIRTPRSPI